MPASSRWQIRSVPFEGSDPLHSVMGQILHGYVADSLYHTLSHLGISCPRPAGGFYLYPDFTLWRSVLLEQEIRTSQDLASHLLNVWNIATLPGSDFGESPEVLRLRLSTSSLYDSEASSPEEHELFLWHLLDQARAPLIPDQTTSESNVLFTCVRACTGTTDSICKQPQRVTPSSKNRLVLLYIMCYAHKIAICMSCTV